MLLSACAMRLRAYYGRRLTGRIHDVEDLVQDTLIAIHTRRESYDPALPFTAWLYGIGRYKLIDHFRRCGIRTTVPIADVPEIGVEGEGDSVLARLDIDRMLAILPAKQADAIRLTRIDGMAISEAAERTGQTETSIKVGVHRGIRKLRAMMQGKR
ncbi:sigma-70 family RNA polymerase sigma factor [Sphingomonas sp. TREG-RG-20F-R18-01]|uniref:sigma-70 family RNA polymerase sigma factor n=1 Tax=Sphingomonas sp. TREG-RG-20F-R18-01 TaxID=2914982 RepID=UPI001F56AB95